MSFEGSDAVQSIRADRSDLAPIGIERHREESLVFHPEGFVEPLLEFRRASVKLLSLILDKLY